MKKSTKHKSRSLPPVPKPAPANRKRPLMTAARPAWPPVIVIPEDSKTPRFNDWPPR